METTMNTILKSQRGKDILVDELYYQYHQNYTRNNLIYWECSQRKAKCCRARLITKLRIQNYEILRKISEHNHSARKSEIVAKKALSELKDKAGTNGSSTRDLITTCVASIDAACRADCLPYKLLAGMFVDGNEMTIFHQYPLAVMIL